MWQLRNAAAHGFSAKLYKLTHHNSHLNLTTDDGATILNAEDFYAALVLASGKYFTALSQDTTLQAAFEDRAKNPDTGVLVVTPLLGRP